MAVILVRHADAEDESASGDAGRVLTPLGRRQARDTAEWLATVVNPLPRVLLVSPLVRTTQTAEILISTWGAGTLSPSPSLRPGQSTAGASTLIRAEPDRGFVGHQPMMGELAAELLGQLPLAFGFDRGAALVLELEPAGHLRFVAFRVPFGNAIRELRG